MRTEKLLETAKIKILQQLFAALAPLCPALCLDYSAFEDVWNRLVALGLREGTARSEWEPMVSLDECDVRLDYVVAEIRSALTARQWAVLSLRYGLQATAKEADGERERQTLEDISRRLHISRERARQIELAALKALEQVNPTLWHSLAATLCTSIDLAGGVLSLKGAARNLTAHFAAGEVNAEAVCHLLFEITDDIIPLQRGSVYCCRSFPTWAYPLVIHKAVRTVKNSLAALSREELCDEVHNQLMAEGKPVDVSIVAACIQADGRFEADLKRTDLNFHLAQILRQMGHPAHFTEIAAKLNASGWRQNLTSERSVGSRLGSERNLFVFVGKGTYGLTEWGSEDKRVFDRFQNGYIGDVIEEFLTERDEPAPTSEIIAFVLARKLCQDYSILQRLSTDDRFHAFERGRYGLKKWIM